MTKFSIRKLTQCRVEAEKREEESRRMPESKMKNREEGEERTRRMFDFSSAESLESSLSLVSGALSASSQEVTEVIVDPERGTREKRYQDGRLEIWYSNGNRKEISSDGKTVKVSTVSVIVVASYHHKHHHIRLGFVIIIVLVQNTFKIY